MNNDIATLAGLTCLYVYDFDPKASPPGVIGEEQFHGGPKKISNAVLVKFADKNVLAFQGTITEFKGATKATALVSVRDWIDNFKVEADRSLGFPGQVHHGFATQLSHISDSVLKTLNDLNPAERQKPLYVTGHSQGGAIATIATKLLEQNGFAVEETYTFAAPRSGDKVFVDSIATTINRIEFGCDIVPHVPFSIAVSSVVRSSLAFLPLPKKGKELLEKLMQKSSISPNYESAGVLYYSREYGQPLKKYNDPVRDVGLNLERIPRLPFNLDRLMKDHSMVHYLGVLK